MFQYIFSILKIKEMQNQKCRCNKSTSLVGSIESNWYTQCTLLSKFLLLVSSLSVLYFDFLMSLLRIQVINGSIWIYFLRAGKYPLVIAMMRGVTLLVLCDRYQVNTQNWDCNHWCWYIPYFEATIYDLKWYIIPYSIVVAILSK